MMIKQNQVNPNSLFGKRKDSLESTTSSTGSHNFRSTNDFDSQRQIIERIPNKFNTVNESKIRRSVKKLNNLKLLGFLKPKDTLQVAKNDGEMFKKIFKVTSKGLTYDNQQYFLQMNAQIMNNHLQRQQSPIERSKINLYDDERIQYQNSSNQQSVSLNNNTIQTEPQQNTNVPNIIVSQNLNNNNTQKKRAPFRRRSCYCNQTGKQSQKSQRIDFLFPTSFIKNMIFMRMKKKQDLKIKYINEKDMIISNLNRTFDFQDKSGRTSAMNSPKHANLNQNFNSNDQTPQNGGRKTPVNGRNRTYLNTQYSQIQKSQFSSINSPKIVVGIQQNSLKPLNINQEKSNGEETNNNVANTQKENQTPQENKERAGQNQSTFSETVENIKSEKIIKVPQKIENPQNNEQNQLIINKSMSVYVDLQSSKNNKLDTSDKDEIINRPPKKSITSSRNSPRNSFIGSPGRSPCSSKKSSIYYSSNNNYFKHQNSSGRKNSNEQPQEKKKKLFAKLRIATKIVGIQERQRKKSLLYQQDYYSALEEIANNVVEQEVVQQKEINNSHLEKKLTFVRKIKNDQKNGRKQTTANQIIDAHNLRFNSTVNSFIDKRAKSQNTLVIYPTADANQSIPINNMRSHLVSPFKLESISNRNNGYYLKTESTYQKTNGTQYPFSTTNNNQRKLNQTERIHTSRSNSSKQVHPFTLNQLPNQKQSTNQKGVNNFYKHSGVSNSDESLEDYLINRNPHNKQNLGYILNYNEGINQQNYKSLNDQNSYDQFGKYDAYFTKNSKQSNNNGNYKQISKTKKKFDLLMNSQAISKDSYLIQNHNLNKDITNSSRSINLNRINDRNSSHPDLLYSYKIDNTSKINNNNNMYNLKIQQQQQNNQSQQSSRNNYVQVKFENKNRKSIAESYLI